jgi:hypothetical protein
MLPDGKENYVSMVGMFLSMQVGPILIIIVVSGNWSYWIAGLCPAKNQATLKPLQQ